jgi:hypothetical protein
MKKLPHIIAAHPVMQGVLKVTFDDGFEGIVDIRPLIAKGKVFAWLNSPDHFNAVQIEEYGQGVSWQDDTGYTIELSADPLRNDAERQAQIHMLMAG